MPAAPPITHSVPLGTVLFGTFCPSATFVTSLPSVGIMECFAFQALDGSFWHVLDVPVGVPFGTSLPAVGIMECFAFQALDVLFLACFVLFDLRHALFDARLP